MKNTELLESLKGLRRHIPDRLLGICGNIRGPELEYLLATLSYSDYPYFSESRAYPVSHPTILNPAIAFCEESDVWAGEYGFRRYALLEYIIMKLEKGDWRKQMNDFNTWWETEGSGMPPLPNEEHSEHVRRICEIAWSNGAYVEHEKILGRWPLGRHPSETDRNFHEMGR
jgi:hypothetical protein